MSDLVFIAFENEKRAEEVRDKVLGMQKEYLIEVSDAVIATRDEGVGGTVVRTSFDHAKENALKEALAGHVPTEAVKIE